MFLSLKPYKKALELDWARISKLERKRNEYIRGKMDAQDMILYDIT